MAAKVLQLVNSSFFGLPQRVESPDHAVSLLGLDIIRPLILCAHAFSRFDEVEVEGFSQEGLMHHSVAVATTAKCIAESRTVAPSIVNDAFIGGLMHDIGKLALAANIPDRYAETIRTAKEEGLWLERSGNSRSWSDTR